MKFAFIFTVFFATSLSFAQTTLEEYKYITKGYKVQVDSGLDMKKGYTLENLGGWEFPYTDTETGIEFNRSVNFNALYRGKKFCAIMAVYDKSDSDLTYYFCIPHSKSDDSIWKLALADFQTAFTQSESKDAYYVCIACLMRLTGVAGSTTLEEYNYLTKGYKVQIDTGLDMKKGYSFKDLSESSLTYQDGVIRSVEFKSLIREKSKTSCAILGIYENSDLPELSNYFCIPSINADKKIWDTALQALSSFDSIESLETLNFSLMRLVAPKD